MQEESFGPVIGIAPVSTEEEAIALMNDIDGALSEGKIDGVRLY